MLLQAAIETVQSEELKPYECRSLFQFKVAVINKTGIATSRLVSLYRVSATFFKISLNKAVVFVVVVAVAAVVTYCCCCRRHGQNAAPAAAGLSTTAHRRQC